MSARKPASLPAADHPAAAAHAGFRAELAALDTGRLNEMWHELFQAGDHGRRALVNLERRRREIVAAGLTEAEMADAHAELSALTVDQARSEWVGRAAYLAEVIVTGQLTRDQQRDLARRVLALYQANAERTYGGFRQVSYLAEGRRG